MNSATKAQSRFRRVTRVVVSVAGAVAVFAATGACGTDSTNTGSSSTLTATDTPTSATSPSGAAGITEQQSQQLCSDLDAQLQEWRIQGPTIGRGGLNIVVQTWAAQSGTINLQVVQNRSIVDEVTIATCPDTRAEAMRSLEIPDLASGLVGF